MHIVIGLITAVTGLLYALDRIGVDIGWLNPFSWARRRAWAKKFEGDPIYSIEDPMHVAAILLVDTARLGGDVSAEQKQRMLTLFAETFSMSEKAANELYVSAVHLLGAPQVVENQLNGVADKNRSMFSDAQATSLFEMIADVIGSSSNETQRAFVESLREKLKQPTPEGSWA